MTYPDGRAVAYNYGTTGGTDDILSRVASIDNDDATETYAQYAYLGASTIAAVNHPEVGTTGLLLTYDPAGDNTLTGLDRFGRVAVSRGPCVQVTALKWIAFASVLSSMLACNHPEEHPVPLTPRLEWFVKEPGLWVPHYIPAFRNPPWSSQEQEAARQYICSHPDRTSYHMALTLFSDWP